MNEQEFMQFIQEFPEVVPYLEADEGLMAEIILNPSFREEIKQEVYVMRGEEPPAPEQSAPQYQYANYGSDDSFLGYTNGESGKSNAMSNSAYVVAPNGQKYNTNNAPQQNYKSNYSNMTPLGLPNNININSNHKNVYSSNWGTEQKHIADGVYDPNSISNPYHHSKTADPFGSDVTKWLVANGYKPSTQGLKTGDTEWGQKFYHPEGKGFTYVDKYGFTHVSEDLGSALTYSRDGKIGEWDGAYGKGYALNEQGGRMHLAGLDGSTIFGNFNDTGVRDLSYTDGYGEYRKELRGNDSPDSIYNGQINPFTLKQLLNQQAGREKEQNSVVKPSQPKPNSQAYQYENFDASGKSMGFTTGTNGKSNYMQGAVSVKAPNGKSYNTGYQPPANNPATTVKSQPALDFKADFNNFKSGVRDIVYGNSSRDKDKSPAVVTAKPSTTAKTATSTTSKVTSGGTVNKNTGSSAGSRIVNSIKDKLLESLRKGK